jgi:hypothetical protein
VPEAVSAAVLRRGLERRPPFTVHELEQLHRLLTEQGVTLTEVLAVLRTRPKTLKALARGR